MSKYIQSGLILLEEGTLLAGIVIVVSERTDHLIIIEHFTLLVVLGDHQTLLLRKAYFVIVLHGARPVTLPVTVHPVTGGLRIQVVVVLGGTLVEHLLFVTVHELLLIDLDIDILLDVVTGPGIIRDLIEDAEQLEQASFGVEAFLMGQDVVDDGLAHHADGLVDVGIVDYGDALLFCFLHVELLDGPDVRQGGGVLVEFGF